MCDFSALRNWLTALAVTAGWAISSAWFSYFMRDVPIASNICWSITAVATLSVLTLLLLTLGAASSFCSCVAAVGACATACTSIRPALAAAILPLIALLGVCLGADANLTLTIIYAATAALGALTIYIGTLAATLGSCQRK
jgi:hypothetical protein